MPHHIGRDIRLLITAGPTHEPIDEVRYLGNRSSGTLGKALAHEAHRRGARVTLLLGPGVAEPHDPYISTLRFRTAADLRRLLQEHADRSDLLIMAAAVADYRPAQPLPSGKLRRAEERLTLELEPVPDLIAELAASLGRASDRAFPKPLLVAFALEPAEGLLDAAQRKMQRKGVDAIVANPLHTMDAATITATLLWSDGRSDPAPADLSKDRFAGWLLDRLLPAVD